MMTREPEDLPYMRRMSHGKLAVMNDTAKVFFRAFISVFSRKGD